jgi:activating signal cointegrator 1
LKALTLTQPWATLVAIGAKRIETRSWRTSYRGPLAIHAAKGFPKWARATVRDDWDFFSVLKPDHAAFLKSNGVRLIPSEVGYRACAELAIGAVIAIGNLVDCLPIESTGCLPGVFEDYAELDTPQERAFGDFSPSRWAWVLDDVKRFPQPIPALGKLSLWEWQAPDPTEGVNPK